MCENATLESQSLTFLIVHNKGRAGAGHWRPNLHMVIETLELMTFHCTRSRCHGAHICSD